MKLREKYKKRQENLPFSGTVEVAITEIDTKHKRMLGAEHRKAFRVDETTLQEVFEVVYSAILSKAGDG